MIAALIGVVMLSSCSVAKQVPYFQDIMSDSILAIIPEPVPIRLAPEDKISILVNSRDPQLMMLFNLPVIQRYIGSDNPSLSSNSYLTGYTLDGNGDIDFPVLGKIHLAGMTREEAAVHIKDQLVSNNLIKDPVVTIEYMNLTVSVLGEVNKPGRYSIDRDRITIFDALSMAGDLTIYGRRDNVSVIREQNGERVIYRVDLRSVDLFDSPAYYLQQNDVVYVEPNKVRAGQSTINENNLKSVSLWVSIASFLTTIITLIVSLSN